MGQMFNHVDLLTIAINFIAVGIFGALLNNRFKKRLETHKAELQKEMDLQRNKLQKKTYVSKLRFDTEFEIYKDLSLSIYQLVVGAAELFSITFPEQFMYIAFPKLNLDAKNLIDNETRKQGYKNSSDIIGLFMQKFYTNCAFIPKDIYEKYENFFGIASQFYRDCNPGGKYYDLDGYSCEKKLKFKARRLRLLMQSLKNMKNSIEPYENIWIH